ncbi:MAG: S-adenosylmethionine:tRNA ribosyltransferase-isomerase, partial [Planctomycetes bacterium]|nr:S-adenosylmethionine:tRNA ribosyltransferase-isomerase [Planctomycetota bacterium]
MRPQTGLPHDAKAHVCVQKADSQMPDWDRLDLYDYNLPEELIAKEPLADRDASRLLVLDRSSGSIQHRTFRDLPGLLRPGDCLVLNDSRVVPARLLGRRLATGGAWEGLYLESTPDGLWKLICQTRGKLQPGERIAVVPAHSIRPRQDALERQSSEARAIHEEPDRDAQLILTLLEVNADGIWLARCEQPGDALDLLQQFGTVPLPPYIRRKLATATDWDRYQTEFA